MKKIITNLAIIIGLSISSSAFSAGAANNLGNCMIDSLNGKERKDLARWIFFAMASHPDINSYSRATTQDINNTDKTIGELITRLLTHDCPSQLKAANKSDPASVKKAFELVGRVAMREIMTNQNVMKSITNYTKSADLEKITNLLAESKTR